MRIVFQINKISISSFATLLGLLQSKLERRILEIMTKKESLWRKFFNLWKIDWKTEDVSS